MLVDTAVLAHAHRGADQDLAAMDLAKTAYATRRMVAVAATWAQLAREVRDDCWAGRRIDDVRRVVLVADVARPSFVVRQCAVGCHSAWHTRPDGLDCRDPAQLLIGAKTAHYSTDGTSPDLPAQYDT